MSDNPTPPPEETDSPAYKRVSADQVAEMQRIREINPEATLEDIAAAVGVKSISTVSYWLSKLKRNTVPETRKLMKGESLHAGLKLVEQVEHGDPRVSQGAAKAILALAGVQEGAQQVSVGVQVVVGSVNQPAGPDPFIDATVVEKP